MRGGGLAVAMLIAAGCQTAGDKRRDAPTAEAKPTKHWLDEAKPEWAKGDVPKAGTWADPRDPKFDYVNSTKGTLAGYVFDAGEKPAPRAIIVVEPANPAAKSNAMRVLTDEAGSFAVHGLAPGETYALTAKLRDGGTMFVGQTYATPPSVHVRIRLKEQVNLPDGPGSGRIDERTPIASRAPVGDLPPLPGPAPVERDRAIPAPERRSTSDGGWSPLPPGRQEPGELPMPGRPEQTATAPAPTWKPPTAEVPAPTIVPPPRTSRKRTIALVDPSGRPAELPNGQPFELLLLDFLSSTCLPCKKFTPELIEFQRRYAANGVEIVGVLCDQAADAERRSLAGKYAKEMGLNYLVYAEAQAGQVQKMFDVKAYPTLVLLDASGEVLWQGHPKDIKALEAVVRNKLKP